jgi:hypothetical protein
MKIRNGFVSNSSSSSFVISGFYLPEGQTIKDVVKKLCSGMGDFPQKRLPGRVRGCNHKEVDAKFCPECGKPMWIEKDYESEYEYALSSYINDFQRKTGLNYEEDVNFIGYAVTSIYDDGGFEVEKSNLQEIVDKTNALAIALELDPKDAKLATGTTAC